MISGWLTAEALRDRSPPRPSDTAGNRAPKNRLVLGGDQLADVRDVALAYRAALTGQDRGDGECVARKRHELDFVGFAAAMDVHNGADIARFQTICRKISGQNHTVVFVDVHSSKG